MVASLGFSWRPIGHLGEIWNLRELDGPCLGGLGVYLVGPNLPHKYLQAYSLSLGEVPP